MRTMNQFVAFATISISMAATYAATVDFGTTNYIAFRCQVDIFEKKVNPVTYRAYAGRLLNTIFHEQYNNIVGPDIKLLTDLDNGNSLFSNVIIGGNGYLKWSAVETNADASTIEDATWHISARTIYSPRSYGPAKNEKTIGESNNHLYRIECFKVHETSEDYYKN